MKSLSLGALLKERETEFETRLSALEKELEESRLAVALVLLYGHLLTPEQQTSNATGRLAALQEDFLCAFVCFAIHG